MYDKTNKYGILNDYNLVHLMSQPRPTGTERTGTRPFIALDLLTKKAWDSKVERPYHHDCKSFIWVLLWVCCCYEGGKQINNPPLSELTEGNHNHCFEKKLAILSRQHHIHPTSSYEKYWGVAIKLPKWPLMYWVQQDADIAPLEPNMNKIIDILYHFDWMFTPMVFLPPSGVQLSLVQPQFYLSLFKTYITHKRSLLFKTGCEDQFDKKSFSKLWE
jgi:hypothetical protein